MAELKFDDPCVLFALRRESVAFRRTFRPHQTFSGAPCRARFCGPSWLTVLVVETGMGADATGKALDWLLGGPLLGNVPYRPRMILSAGFCAGLRTEHVVGDLFLATEMVDTLGGVWPTTWPGDLPPGRWEPPLHRGRLLTVSGVVGTPDEKHALGEKYDALGADMESATVAKACAERGVPFGCLRAVSDTAAEGLSPRLVSALAGGRVSPFRLMAGVVRSPHMVGELWRLARNTSKAGRQLAAALGEVLTLTLPDGAEL
jgi:nucleoside phosphorylase